MTHDTHTSWLRMMGTVGILATATAGCRPSDVLSVPPPLGQVTSSAVQNQAEAESVLNQGLADAFVSIEGNYPLGLSLLSGLLADEFTYTNVSQYCCNTLDARNTAISAANNYGTTLEQVLLGRTELLDAVVPLQQYEVGGGLAKIGEAYALTGYLELLLAEDYCAGVPLSHAIFGGGFVWGTPLTTDSLFGVAEAHFDSALAHAASNDTIQSLAAIGLGRTLMDRGRYDSAATAVQNVPTSFVYNTVMAPSYSPYEGSVNFYTSSLPPIYPSCSQFNVSDREGENGLNFISAGDPRLLVSSTLGETCDGDTYHLPDSVFYYPLKFGNPSTTIPLATGVEARLIEAEAALNANQAATWATDLNTLRASAPSTYLQADSGFHALPTDSTTAASADEQIAVMFRERAFWLFGMGNRLGDMRRLIRQYGQDGFTANTVYPTGPYDATLQGLTTWTTQLRYAVPIYGADVSLPLPTATSGLTDANPNYVGCLTSTSTP